jgi:hypothetical protein
LLNGDPTTLPHPTFPTPWLVQGAAGGGAGVKHFEAPRATKAYVKAVPYSGCACISRCNSGCYRRFRHWTADKADCSTGGVPEFSSPLTLQGNCLTFWHTTAGSLQLTQGDTVWLPLGIGGPIHKLTHALRFGAESGVKPEGMHWYIPLGVERHGGCPVCKRIR